MVALTLAALSIVAIELPPDADRVAAARAVESCAAVLGERECVSASEGAEATWRATIEWVGQRLTVTLRDAQGTEVATSELVFASQDSVTDRWVTVGLMVAALTAAQPRRAPERRPAAAAPSVAPPGSSSAPASPLPQPVARWIGWVDAGALVGGGFGVPVVGGQGRATWFMSAPGLGLTAGFRAAGAGGQPTLHWLEGEFGTAGLLTSRSSRFGVSLCGEFLLQRVWVGVESAGEQRTKTLWRGGGRLGLRWSWRLGPRASLWAAGDLAVLRPRLDVRLARETIAQLGPVGWSAGVGTAVTLGQTRR